MKIKEGQIVRRKTLDGTPEGPWLYVRQSECRWVYTSPIINGKKSKDERMGLVLRERVWIPKIAYLPISLQVMRRIRFGVQKKVSHLPTKKWNALITEQPDLIAFYTPDGDEWSYFTIEDITLSVVTYQRTVSIYLKERIL